MSREGTHIVVCTNPDALEHLISEWVIIGVDAKEGTPMEGGDAMVARDTLLEAGYKWGKDFYIKRIDTVGEST